jgi:hypothetical protein
MLSEIDLDEYRAAIREEVCSLCPERPPGGPPCAPLGKDCGVEMHLPHLIDSIRQVHSPLIAPYLARNQERICATCAFLRKGDRCPCPMEYLVVPLVEAVEAVDERRQAREGGPARQETPATRLEKPMMTNKVTLTVVDGSLEGMTCELVGPQRCVIGRADDCTIHLTGSLEFCTVSRHHCVVEVRPDGAYLRDLGSYNGTRVNGVQVGWPRNRHLPAAVPEAAAREIALHDGDVFQVGDTSFGVTIAGPAEDGSPWEVDTPLGEELAGGCAGCAHGLAVQRLPKGG